MNIQDLEQHIRDLLAAAAAPVNEVVFFHDEDDGIHWFEIRTDDPHYFLKKNAEVLSSFNYLVRKIAEKVLPADTLREMTIILDVDKHERGRIENLKATAHMMAERARFFRRDVEVPPMPPEDRKIIHTFLAKAKDLETLSLGEGSERRVIVKYKESE